MNRGQMEDLKDKELFATEGTEGSEMKIQARYDADAVRFDGSLDAISDFLVGLGYDHFTFRFLNAYNHRGEEKPDTLEVTIPRDGGGGEWQFSLCFGDWMVMRNINEENEFSSVVGDFFRASYALRRGRGKI